MLSVRLLLSLAALGGITIAAPVPAPVSVDAETSPTMSLSASALPPIATLLSPDELVILRQLADQKVTPQTPYWFPVGTMAYFLILYLICQALHGFVYPLVLGGKKWHAFSVATQRTMVIYVLQIVITSAALILQFVSSPMLGMHFTPSRTACIRAASVLIGGLYLTELLYRHSMRPAMIAHHVLTIFAMSLTLVMLEERADPSFILSGWCWLFQATTEQLTFMALIAYRLHLSPGKLRPFLRVSSIQSLICKFASTIGTAYIWGRWQRHDTSSLGLAYSVIFWIAAIGLALTQAWGSWVVWMMGDTLEKRFANHLENKQSTIATHVVEQGHQGHRGRDEKDDLQLPSGAHRPDMGKEDSDSGSGSGSGSGMSSRADLRLGQERAIQPVLMGRGDSSYSSTAVSYSGNTAHSHSTPEISIA